MKLVLSERQNDSFKYTTEDHNIDSLNAELCFRFERGDNVVSLKHLPKKRVFHFHGE
jgi:hypothetical protein